MDKLNLFERAKRIISGVAFKVFLWSIGMTMDAYFKCIYEQEKETE